ncbi:MAG: hypothetical protein DWI22_10185 [Planctomycetota bacterium]|nr:MAG: hypothetical protein DWI22_10185 [Planctomycetota bacterium]
MPLDSADCHEQQVLRHAIAGLSESSKTPLISLSFPTSASSSVQVAIRENPREFVVEPFCLPTQRFAMPATNGSGV